MCGRMSELKCVRVWVGISEKMENGGSGGCPPRRVLPRRGNFFSSHGSSLLKNALFCLCVFASRDARDPCLALSATRGCVAERHEVRRPLFSFAVAENEQNLAENEPTLNENARKIVRNRLFLDTDRGPRLFRPNFHKTSSTERLLGCLSMSVKRAVCGMFIEV